jgi:hypothetical protein
MQPGQLQPNEFEAALLGAYARQDSALGNHISDLHVISREFTGVGSFTEFQHPEVSQERDIVLDAQIQMPGVPNGLGSVLFCRGDQPRCLEIYTFGDEHWDGRYDGFSINRTA